MGDAFASTRNSSDDNDFEQEIIDFGKLPLDQEPHHQLIGAIIQEYSSRQLPVEGQLAIYLMRCCQEHECSIHELIANYNYCAERPHNQEFAKLWKLVDQNKVKQLAVFK